MKKKIVSCLILAAVVSGCSADNTKESKMQKEVIHYKKEKVKTVDHKELEKTVINGSPTPPEGVTRPVVNIKKTDEKENNMTKKEF